MPSPDHPHFDSREAGSPEGAAGRGVRVLGLGGAGIKIVDGLEDLRRMGVELAVADTDMRALEKANATTRWPLGARRTRGLSAGGDPLVGRVAAEDSCGELSQWFEGAETVFVVAGLGGGTGSGGVSVVAEAIRKSGPTVIVLAVMPFSWEGARRQDQAGRALDQIRRTADGVLCVDNDQIQRLFGDETPAAEVFLGGNQLLGEGVRGICRMLLEPGLLDLDAGALRSVLRGHHMEGAFASVEVSGAERATQAVAQLMAHPLLHGGQGIQDARSCLVSLVGGPDLAMSEVATVLQGLQVCAPQAMWSSGAAVDTTMGDRLKVTWVVARTSAEAGERNEGAVEAAEAGVDSLDRMRAGASMAVEVETTFFHAPPAGRSTSRFNPPPPSLTDEQKERLFVQQAGRRGRKSAGSRWQQGMLPLEVASRGRFEKSEPTIHHGQDLDVPTYVRRGMVLDLN